MLWLLLTAVSVFFRSILGVLSKMFSNRMLVSSYTQAFLFTTAGAVLAVLLSPVFGKEAYAFSGVNIVTVSLVVFGQGLGNVLYFAAMKNLTSGTAQIAFSSILVFNTLLSVVFMGLDLSLLNVAGIFLLLVAMLSVVQGRVGFSLRGIALMVLSAFLFSIFQLASAELSQQVGVIIYLLIAFGGASVVVFAAKGRSIVKELREVTNLRQTLAWPFLIIVPSLGYFTFSYYAYRHAPEPARVAILLTSQVVLTVLLGYLFLHEKEHVYRKVGAACLVIVAAALIKG